MLRPSRVVGLERTSTFGLAADVRAQGCAFVDDLVDAYRIAISGHRPNGRLTKIASPHTVAYIHISNRQAFVGADNQTGVELSWADWAVRTLLRPARLAAYSAVSAAAMTAAPVEPCCG